MKVKVNDVYIHYHEVGSGAPLFLIHGFGGNHTYWQPQVEAFSEKYRVITYDQRGCGESGQPASFRMLDLVADQHQLMLALDASPAFLIGFSQGGVIALLTATNHPEAVLGLVMHDASTDFVAPDPTVMQQQKQQAELMISRIRQLGSAGFADMFTPMNFSPGLKDRQPSVWKLYYTMLKRSRPETLIKIMHAGVESPPSPPDLSRIKCPVLFIQGELDEMITADKRKRSQETIPGSQLVVIPGVGHASAAEAPDVFNKAVLEFLGRL